VTTKPMKREGRVRRRAVRRLEERIHGGQHTSNTKCGCNLWDRDDGFTKPGSLKGSA